jgi:hypothetical protein
MAEEILPEGVRQESHCATNESRILMFFAPKNCELKFRVVLCGEEGVP